MVPIGLVSSIVGAWRTFFVVFRFGVLFPLLLLRRCCFVRRTFWPVRGGRLPGVACCWPELVSG